MADDRWLDVAARIAASILDGMPVPCETMSPHADSVSVESMRLIASVVDAHRTIGDRTGNRWGTLEILERIGAGAFGVVYRARDPALDRDVALKLLQHHGAHAIVEEGRLLARVRHPNVVTIHGAAEHDRQYGIWMELLAGRTLSAIVVESGPLPWDEVAPIGIDICRALAAVHDAALLHGDIKAQNVMREPNGRIVLMDFGTGRLAADAAQARFAGTPLYLAPEILAGAPPDVRSDLYAVGVLLYYLLTAAFPVEGRTLEDVRVAHGKSQRRRLEERRSDIPTVLTAVIERAISPEPDARFDSAIAFERALAGAISTRKRRLAATWAATTLLVTGSLAAAVWGWEATRPRPIAFGPRDFVLIGAFDNRTGMRSLDGVVEAAIEQDLANSRYVNTVPQPRIDDALRLMKKPVDTSLQTPVAREVSLRDGGIRAFVTGRIDKIGDRYELTASIFDPKEDRLVRSATKEAVGDHALAPAIRTLSYRIRGDLGESAAEIQLTAQKYEKVTTPSLEAVGLYTRSYELGGRNEWPAALSLVTEAIAKDPDFAMAHVWRGWCLRRTNGPPEQVKSEGRRALELSSGVSDWERLWIQASDDRFRGADDEEIGHLTALLKLYPDHYWAVSNLVATLRGLDRGREALPYAVHRSDLKPTDARAAFAAATLLEQYGDPAKAQPYVDRARRLLDGQPWLSGASLLWFFPTQTAWRKGDTRQEAATLDRLPSEFTRTSPGERTEFAKQLVVANLSLGRLRAAAAGAEMIPDENSRHFNRAVVAFHAGDRAVFDREMRGVERQQGMAFDSTLFYLVEAGRNDDARALFDLSRPVMREAARVEEAHILARHDQLRAALATLLAARPPSDSAQVRYKFELLSELYEREGDHAKAIAALQEALGVSRTWDLDHWWLRNELQLAELYHQEGRDADAAPLESDLDRSLAAADSDFPLLVRLKALEASTPAVRRAGSSIH